MVRTTNIGAMEVPGVRKYRQSYKDKKAEQDYLLQRAMQRDFPTIQILKRKCTSCKESYPLIADYWNSNSDGTIHSKNGRCKLCIDRFNARLKAIREAEGLHTNKQAKGRLISNQAVATKDHKFCSNADCPHVQPLPVSQFYKGQCLNGIQYYAGYCKDCTRTYYNKIHEELRRDIEEGLIPDRKCKDRDCLHTGKQHPSLFNIRNGMIASRCKECENRTRRAKRKEKNGTV